MSLILIILYVKEQYLEVKMNSKKNWQLSTYYVKSDLLKFQI